MPNFSNVALQSHFGHHMTHIPMSDAVRMVREGIAYTVKAKGGRPSIVRLYPPPPPPSNSEDSSTYITGSEMSINAEAKFDRSHGRRLMAYERETIDKVDNWVAADVLRARIPKELRG